MKKKKKKLENFHIFGYILEPNREIWQLENQKTTLFSHFWKKQIG
jgi:hypothetical protein